MQRAGRQQNENDPPPPQTQRDLYNYLLVCRCLELKDPEDKPRARDVRFKAAAVLGQLAAAGEHAAAAVPALAKGLEDRDPDTRRVCVDALGRIAQAEMPPGTAEDDLGYSLRRKIRIFSKTISPFFATPLLRMR